MISAFELDPVHTRHVTIRGDSVDVAGGGRRIRGRLLDLRHRGTTWVGELPTRPGLVHDMSAELMVDGAGHVTHAAGAMERPAFEAGVKTNFESCRDILGNVGGLAGGVVHDGMREHITATIGGVRGCYHLTTLVRAMAPLAARPALRERRLRIEGWRRGERAVVVDARLEDFGGDPGDGDGVDRRTLAHAGLRFAVAVDDPRPHELRVDHRLTDADGRERECFRTAATAETLSRVPLLPGFARSLGDHVASGSGCDALIELAFAVSAVVSQILLHLAWPAVAGTGGRAANTCVMWRAGGPLQGRPIAKDDA
jgi:hypothetical protein